MQYKFLLILFLVLVLAGCTSNAQENEARVMSEKTSSGKIEIFKNKIDLGNISMKDGKVDVEFLLKNTGKDPVVVMDGETSCTCTNAVLKSKYKNSDGADTTIASSKIVMPHGAIKPTQIYQIIEPDEEATVVATFDPNAHGPNGTGTIRRNIFLNTNSTFSPKIDLSFMGNVVK